MAKGKDAMIERRVQKQTAATYDKIKDQVVAKVTVLYGIGTRACGLSGAFRQLAFAFKFSDMVKQ